MPPLDAVFLGHMLTAVERISELIGKVDRETFDRDWVIQDAVIRELEILGEAAGRLSDEFVADHPEIPWREITGMRHKLIHDYFFVDLNIVWRTATANVAEVAHLLKASAQDLK
jgi:uncharacterized protein with HEPN domain